jgi:hypothetical protein
MLNLVVNAIGCADDGMDVDPTTFGIRMPASVRGGGLVRLGAELQERAGYLGLCGLLMRRNADASTDRGAWASRLKRTQSTECKTPESSALAPESNQIADISICPFRTTRSGHCWRTGFRAECALSKDRACRRGDLYATAQETAGADEFVLATNARRTHELTAQRIGAKMPQDRPRR